MDNWRIICLLLGFKLISMATGYCINWSSWSTSTICQWITSESCKKVYTRVCLNGIHYEQSENCKYNNLVTKPSSTPCQENSCPLRKYWTEWEPWSSWSTTGCPAKRSRNRICSVSRSKYAICNGCLPRFYDNVSNLDYEKRSTRCQDGGFWDNYGTLIGVSMVMMVIMIVASFTVRRIFYLRMIRRRQQQQTQVIRAVPPPPPGTFGVTGGAPQQLMVAPGGVQQQWGTPIPGYYGYPLQMPPQPIIALPPHYTPDNADLPPTYEAVTKATTSDSQSGLEGHVPPSSLLTSYPSQWNSGGDSTHGFPSAPPPTSM